LKEALIHWVSRMGEKDALNPLEEPLVDFDEASSGRSREYEVSFEFSCISLLTRGRRRWWWGGISRMMMPSP
jgi:hypothetical protein